MIKLLKHKLFLTPVFILGLGAMFFGLMPEPIDMSIEKIGNGSAAVVFIYDPNLAASNQQANEINKAREVLGDTINFLIAKVGDPNSEDFRKKYKTRPAELLFFNDSGQLIGRDRAVMYSEELVAKHAM